MPYKATFDRKEYARKYYQEHKTVMGQQAAASSARAKERDPEAFAARRRKDRLRYVKRYPEKIRAYTQQHQKQRVAELRAIVLGFKDSPCCDCKKEFVCCVMEFDHTRGEKKFTINPSNMARRTDAEILDEIDKCDLVCANCHRIRTCIRRQQGGSQCPAHHSKQ